MGIDLSRPFARHINKRVIEQALAKFFPDSRLNKYRIFKKGWENLNVFVKTTKEQVVLRFYALKHLDKLRKKEDIIFILEFQEFLYNQGIFVPRIYKTTKTDYVIQIKLGENNHLVAAHSYITGKEISKYTQKSIEVIAKALAMMHTAATHFKPKHYSSFSNMYNFATWFNDLKKSLAEKYRQMDIMQNLEKYILPSLKNIRSKNLQSIIIHGDINKENLLFEKDKLAGVLDFDDSHKGSRAEDIGIFFADCFDGLTSKRMIKRIKIFFRAYTSVDRISQKEQLLSLHYCILKWAVTQYFYNTNDLLDGRSLDTPENREHIHKTFKNLESLREAIDRKTIQKQVTILYI